MKFNLHDQRLLESAEGWLELGNWHEANEELEQITAEMQEHPFVLRGEFKNGVLNSYEFVSSFDEDKTRVDLQGVGRLTGEIGKFSHSDVISVLGEPDGKSLCPSMVGDYKDKCAKGVEIWAWFAAEKLKFGFSNHVDVKDTNVYVTFDANGKLSDVQTDENNRRVITIEKQ